MNLISRTSRSKPNVCVVVDRPNWAYDIIAQQLVKFCGSELCCEIRYLKNSSWYSRFAWLKFDYFFFVGFQNLFNRNGDIWTYRYKFMDRHRIITGIHSHHSWDRGQSNPSFTPSPDCSLIDRLSEVRGVNTVSRRLQQVFEIAGLNELVLTENGVDTSAYAPSIFPATKVGLSRNSFRVGFSGNDRHDGRKGISTYIVPAVDRFGGTLVCAMPGAGYLPPSQMPQFYRGLDAYICASSSEGFSLSVLEAAACAVPVISTKVGGCEDLFDDGVDGLLVDRTVDSFADALELLYSKDDLRANISLNIRAKIVSRYDWKDRVRPWLTFLEKCI